MTSTIPRASVSAEAAPDWHVVRWSGRAWLAPRLRPISIAAAVTAIVVAANVNQGAYFSQSWGWVALSFWMPTTVALILGSTTTPGALRIAFPLLLSGFTCWVLLSATWSVSASGSMRDAERLLVYVGVASAVAIVLDSRDAPAVGWGAMLGSLTVSVYALSTRLLSGSLGAYDDPTAPGRLSTPLGYSNALALLAVIGACLALGFVAHARAATARLAAAAAVPLFFVTIYFTFSRAAWPALILGLVATFAIDPRRLTFLWTTLATLPAVAAALWIASTPEVHEDASVVFFRGVPIAIWILGLCVTAAICAGFVILVARRFGPMSTAVRRGHAVVLALVLVGAIAVLVTATGIRPFPSELRARFDAPLPPEDARERLFSLSGNGRAEELSVAWLAARRHPVVGNGSGSYEYLWYELRESQRIVRDAHSLYAEAFAEVGLVGLSLLLLALLVPLAAALRRRRMAIAAPGVGAYVAWIAAAGLDWHWEMVGVTLTALLSAGAVLLATDRRRFTQLRADVRAVLVATCVLLSLVAVVVLVGNQALFAGKEAVARDDWASARHHGRRAQALLFWSHEPELVLGDAAAGLGDRKGALASYRDAVRVDPRNWAAWLRLAQVARGTERSAAYATVRRLNPRERNLPGESRASSG